MHGPAAAGARVPAEPDRARVEVQHLSEAAPHFGVRGGKVRGTHRITEGRESLPFFRRKDIDVIWDKVSSGPPGPHCHLFGYGQPHVSSGQFIGAGLADVKFKITYLPVRAAGPSEAPPR